MEIHRERVSELGQAGRKTDARIGRGRWRERERQAEKERERETGRERERWRGRGREREKQRTGGSHRETDGEMDRQKDR